MRVLTAVIIIAAIGLITLSASADINIGGLARSTAMGGAGLASTDNPAVTALMNPAAFAMMHRGFSFQFPNASLRMEGASLGDITDWANNIWDLSGQEGIDLARELGKQDTMLDVGVTTGLALSTLSVTADAEARVRISPNAAFRTYAETGILPADPTTISATIQAESVAALPAIGFGFKVPKFASGKGDLWIGTRVRAIKGKYVRRTISGTVTADPDDVLVTSDEPVQDESGIGADLGIIYRSSGPAQMSYGLAVTNLIKPGLGSIEQDRIWSVGVAAKPHSKVMLVADLVNITKAYDEGMKLRAGIEFKPIRLLALRAGYSGEAFTTGFGLFGFDFAFASRTPLSISRTIRF
jgi:hypothetical protein